MIITRTPYRISLYGGGSDIPKYYNYSKRGGAVISFSLKRYIYIIVKKSVVSSVGYKVGHRINFIIQEFIQNRSI